jgi:hypothetical protein
MHHAMGKPAGITYTRMGRRLLRHRDEQRSRTCNNFPAHAPVHHVLSRSWISDDHIPSRSAEKYAIGIGRPG